MEVKVKESKMPAKLESAPEEEPSLIFFTGEEDDIELIEIVGDEQVLHVGTTSVSHALVVLAACYYVFDVQYPRRFSQVLGFIQHFVFEHKFDQKASEKFKQEREKVAKGIAKDWPSYSC